MLTRVRFYGLILILIIKYRLKMVYVDQIMKILLSFCVILSLANAASFGVKPFAKGMINTEVAIRIGELEISHFELERNLLKMWMSSGGPAALKFTEMNALLDKAIDRYYFTLEGEALGLSKNEAIVKDLEFGCRHILVRPNGLLQDYLMRREGNILYSNTFFWDRKKSIILSMDIKYEEALLAKLVHQIEDRIKRFDELETALMGEAICEYTTDGKNESLTLFEFAEGYELLAMKPPLTDINGFVSSIYEVLFFKHEYRLAIDNKLDESEEFLLSKASLYNEMIGNAYVFHKLEDSLPGDDSEALENKYREMVESGRLPKIFKAEVIEYTTDSKDTAERLRRLISEDARTLEEGSLLSKKTITIDPWDPSAGLEAIALRICRLEADRCSGIVQKEENIWTFYKKVADFGKGAPAPFERAKAQVQRFLMIDRIAKIEERLLSELKLKHQLECFFDRESFIRGFCAVREIELIDSIYAQ